MFEHTTETKKMSYIQISHAYQSILRGCIGIISAYYAMIFISLLLPLNNIYSIKLLFSTFVTFLFSISSYYLLKEQISINKLELIVFTINILILINVLLSFEGEYDESKLVYFTMMSIFFAFAKASIRQAVFSIFLTQASLFVVVAQNQPERIGEYGYISFAATLSSVGLTYFLQRGIGLAIAARQDADRARAKAEERLQIAQQLGEKMRSQALSDSLTGLPNRRSFFEQLAASAIRRGTPTGAWLVLLDLDGFKAVNDNYGHFIGDRLLEAVAGRLREHCGSDTCVSRMGGDEFNIILADCISEDQAEAWCTALLEKIAKVYLIEDRLIQISASAGCYRPEKEDEDAKLMQRADFALLYAKRSGKNRVVVFRDEHARDAAERFKIEQALRQADFGDEIELLFQPQFDLMQNCAVSVEALARWHSPIIGTIPPHQFIKIAEESGLIANITLAVLDKALAQLQAWSSPIPLSINLSGQDLTSDQIIDQIIDRIRKSGINPGYIEFEVTETAMMPDTRRAAANLKRLASLGHPIALDDFGTGYSNFSYLRTLPISKLKVDRSFMENITDPMTEKILLGLVGMARTLGVHCLLEGIESELELIVAKRVGAQSIQGYLFGMPMTGVDIEVHFKMRGCSDDNEARHRNVIPVSRSRRSAAH